MLAVFFLLLKIGAQPAHLDHQHTNHGGNKISESGKPIVETPLGSLEGEIRTTRLNKTVYCFTGIRYAEPPIGELRFKPPVPVRRWSGIYDATKDGPSCPQPGFQPTSEDCLFINVYTRNLPGVTHSEREKWPVFFFIHPGGFYSGSSRSNWAGPEYITDQRVVFVTINYRLGSLGFISTGDSLAPGNNGLRDQVQALRWVQQNIESFGGNKNSVTVYGYSAGGASVALHLLSPMSKGLFHRAILGSGSNYGNYPVPRHQFDLAAKQARLVGCPDDSSEKIMACLKNASAEALGNSLRGFEEFQFQPIWIWLPVIEPDVGQEVFLPEHPVDMIKSGKLSNLPVLTGITKDEFGYIALEMLENSTFIEELNRNSDVVFPICFIYERNTKTSNYITQELKKFYFGSSPIGNDTFEALAHIFADGIIGYAVNIGAKLLSRYSNQPVYYYRFSYQGRYSFNYLPNTNDTVPFGVVHHDDLIYILRSTYFPLFDSSYKEAEMVDTLTSFYARFAETGNPNPGRSYLWKEFDLNNNYYLDIGESLELKSNLYKDRYDEWTRLFAPDFL